MRFCNFQLCSRSPFFGFSPLSFILIHILFLFFIFIFSLESTFILIKLYCSIVPFLPQNKLIHFNFKILENRWSLLRISQNRISDELDGLIYQDLVSQPNKENEWMHLYWQSWHEFLDNYAFVKNFDVIFSVWIWHFIECQDQLL